MKQWMKTSSHAFLLGHLEQRVKMREQRVHAAVAAQAHQMQPMRARVTHRVQQYGFLKNSPDEIIRSMRVTSI